MLTVKPQLLRVKPDRADNGDGCERHENDQLHQFERRLGLRRSNRFQSRHLEKRLHDQDENIR